MHTPEDPVQDSRDLKRGPGSSTSSTGARANIMDSRAILRVDIDSTYGSYSRLYYSPHIGSMSFGPVDPASLHFLFPGTKVSAANRR